MKVAIAAVLGLASLGLFGVAFAESGSLRSPVHLGDVAVVDVPAFPQGGDFKGVKADAKPADAKTAEAKAPEAKAPETRPEAKPTEVKAADPKPVAGKPAVEAKAADPKPVVGGTPGAPKFGLPPKNESRLAIEPIGVQRAPSSEMESAVVTLRSAIQVFSVAGSVKS